nr:hypothetical protein [Tanacetum cinerariifolium]
MAQPQRPADVHQDELCPPNKCYALMDANKKIDLDNPIAMDLLGEFWHTFQEDGLKYRLKFVLDRKEITFSEMVPDFLNTLGFTLELRSPSNFKKTRRVQPWQTLGKIFTRCLTTRVTGHDQPPLQIMQIARDKYHNLEDDAMVKNIFNSGKHKDGVGMKIPSWMITDEMKLMDHYRIKAKCTKVKEHLIAEEIEKLVEGAETGENVEVDSSCLRQNDNPIVPVTRLEPRMIRKVRSYLFEHLKTRFMSRKKFHALAQHLQEVMEESLPKMVNERVKELTKKQVSLYVAEGLIMEREKSQTDVAKMIADSIQQERENLRAEISSQITDSITNHIPSPSVVRLRDQDDPHDDAHPEGENDAKRQKTSEHGTFVSRESSSGQDYESEPGPSTSDQIQNFLKNDIVWESGKEILVSPHPQNPTLVVQSCQIDPKALVLSLVNQDLLYLKKGSSGPEKIVMSLHKFFSVIFPDNDIEERTSIWVDKCMKKFNPYPRYNVEHWKNPLAKILYINKQIAPEKPKEEIYSNSKIVQIIKTYWELGHQHKFITKIVARRANGNIVSITESDYKNLNKYDIEDMYLLIVCGKVVDYAETRLLWSLLVIIRSIEKYKMFSIVSKLVYGIIYKNRKKEKKVIRHQEISKFCDATLKRVLEGLKSYNNDVKYGYVTSSLSKEDVEYLQLFEKEIEERLKHRDQIDDGKCT